MSSGQGDAKLFARVCSSQSFFVKLESHLPQPPCFGGKLFCLLKALVSEVITVFDLILPLQPYHGRLPRVPSDI